MLTVLTDYIIDQNHLSSCILAMNIYRMIDIYAWLFQLECLRIRSTKALAIADMLHAGVLFVTWVPGLGFQECMEVYCINEVYSYLKAYLATTMIMLTRAG